MLKNLTQPLEGEEDIVSDVWWGADEKIIVPSSIVRTEREQEGINTHTEHHLTKSHLRHHTSMKDSPDI